MINILKRLVKAFIPERWLVLLEGLISIPKRVNTIERNLQKLLRLNYDSIAEDLGQGSTLLSREFRVFCQDWEDGLLLYIFNKVGTTNRCFVEFGIGDGKECNTANLSINFGWRGLLIDADENNIEKAKYYYKNRQEENLSQIKIVRCFLTMENINKVLLDNGIEGEIDLLSIDVDGNDYWLWKAINAIKPRVVVIEYNQILGPGKLLTVKYDPNFEIGKKHPSGHYRGASLAALTKLANSKGYILIGCESNGVDAFFVRKDVAQGKLFEVSVQEAYYPKSRLGIVHASEQFERIKHLDFVRI